jgi:hypothetical protein
VRDLITRGKGGDWAANRRVITRLRGGEGVGAGGRGLDQGCECRKGTRDQVGDVGGGRRRWRAATAAAAAGLSRIRGLGTPERRPVEPQALGRARRRRD